jgi:hypothetical protein
MPCHADGPHMYGVKRNKTSQHSARLHLFRSSLSQPHHLSLPPPQLDTVLITERALAQQRLALVAALRSAQPAAQIEQHLIRGPARGLPAVMVVSSGIGVSRGLQPVASSAHHKRTHSTSSMAGDSRSDSASVSDRRRSLSGEGSHPNNSSAAGSGAGGGKESPLSGEYKIGSGSVNAGMLNWEGLELKSSAGGAASAVDLSPRTTGIQNHSNGSPSAAGAASAAASAASAVPLQPKPVLRTRLPPSHPAAAHVRRLSLTAPTPSPLPPITSALLLQSAESLAAAAVRREQREAELLRVVQTGVVMEKYGVGGTPSFRHVSVNSDCSELRWAKVDKNKKPKSSGLL